MVRYTSPITYKHLLGKLQDIAQQMKAKVVLDEGNDDYKVTSSIHLVFKDGSSVEFYDFKQTVKYDDNKKSIAAFRKSAYEYHVQGSNEMIVRGVMQMLDMDSETPDNVTQLKRTIGDK